MSTCLVTVLKLVSGRAIYRFKASSQANLSSVLLYGFTFVGSGDVVSGGGGTGARKGDVGGSGEDGFLFLFRVWEVLGMVVDTSKKA